MERKIELFFIYTNPLFFILAFFVVLYDFILKILGMLGILDWYIILFKLKSADKVYKKNMLEIITDSKRKKFWLKRLAWQRAKNILEKELNEGK